MSRISASLRSAVCRRARGLCEYCRSCPELTGHDFTVDHIVPRSSGGAGQLPNLAWCCFWCNNFKQSRTQAVDPKTSHRVALFHPRVDEWEAHFRWSRDGTRLIGITPTGRATIKALRLNRTILVQARRIWVRHGLHPPDKAGPPIA